jgi:LruC domain-containing protein/uncharacterized repeat protein (TIGR01451 family)
MDNLNHPFNILFRFLCTILIAMSLFGQVSSIYEVKAHVSPMNEQSTRSTSENFGTHNNSNLISTILDLINSDGKRNYLTDFSILDLNIFKTDYAETVISGSSITYEIIVNNPGVNPNVAAFTDPGGYDADGAILKDPAIAGLSVTGVNCKVPVSSTAVCPTTKNTVADLQGNGIIIPTFPSGSSLVFTLTAIVTATGGTIENVATITAPEMAIEINPQDNTSTDIDDVTPPPNADLSITKSDGSTTVLTNGVVIYSIVVANSGPGAANGAVLTDPAVPGLSVMSVSCGSATNGAVCPTSGNSVAELQGDGIIIPTLPNGGSLTFTVNAIVTANKGTVSNTATITPPAGTTDPTPANTSSVDTDTVIPEYSVFVPMVLFEGSDIHRWAVSFGYEDLPTSKGKNDYDYNDWVVNVHGTNQYTSASSGLLKQMVFTFSPRARGAAYNHTFQMSFPANTFGSSGTAVVTLYDKNHAVLDVQTLPFTANAENLFTIFPKTNEAIPGVNENTVEDKAHVTVQRYAELSITFTTPFAFSSKDDALTQPHGEALFFDPILKVLNTGEEIHQKDIRLLSVPANNWLWPEETLRIDRAYPMVLYKAGNPPAFIFPELWWTNYNHCVYDGKKCSGQ